MIFRTALIGFIFLFIGKGVFAQEGNPLDSIEIRVNEEMVAVASAILESTRTGTVQQGDDFFNSFLRMEFPPQL